MRVQVCALSVSAVCGGLALALNDARSELIDTSHLYYQGQFENLDATKNSIFGTARIESSQIKGHLRSGGDPAYRSKEFANWFLIYGSNGHPLNPTTLKLRYQRMPNGSASAMMESDALTRQLQKFDAKAFVTVALGHIRSKKPGYFSRSVGAVTYEARPFRLSKAECLPCHSGMKLGDPVAIGVWATVPVNK